MALNLRLTCSTIGAIIGIAGLEHGVGEVLQGNEAPKGLSIKSWPNSRLYDIVDGEPAFTILPSLLLAGIITIMVSILFIIWIVFLLESSYKEFNAVILIAFSVTMLLSGGGVAPPLIGLLLSFFIKKINPNIQEQQKEIQLDDKIAKMWLASYILFIVAFLSLWPGLIILGLIMKIDDSQIVIYLVLISLTSLIMALYLSTLLESEINKDNTLSPNYDRYYQQFQSI